LKPKESTMASLALWRWNGIAAGLLGVCASARAQQGGVAGDEPAAAGVEGMKGEAEATEGTLNFRLPSPDWTVRIEPRAWWTSPSGEVKLPAASGTGPGSFVDSGQAVDVSRLNLDTPRLSAAGEVEVSAERWRFGFSAGGFALDREATVADSGFRVGSVEVSPGELMNVRMEYSTFELTLGYEVWSRDLRRASKVPENAIDAGLRVVLLTGARIHDLDFEVASVADGTVTGTDQTYFELMGGARFELEFVEQITFALQVSGGAWAEANRSVFSFDMSVAFRWEPSRNFGVEVGWRQMLLIMQDGEEGTVEEFEYTGGVAGLFAGVVVRF